VPPTRSTGTWPPAIRPGTPAEASPAEPSEAELTVPPSAARPRPGPTPPPRFPPTPPPIPAAGRPPTDSQWPAAEPPSSAPPQLPERHGTGSWPPPLRDARRTTRSPAQAAAAGRSDLSAGRLDDARALLEEAFHGEPSDLTLARDLQRIAEKQGRHEDYIRLGEIMADALAAYDPLAAAARFRHFAEVARIRLGRDEQAAALLEKALALAPDDAAARRELLELWASRPDTAPRALASWLEAARADPSDATALSAVVSLCAGLSATAPRVESQRLTERGRIVASLCTFLAPGRVGPPPPVQTARALPPGLRDRVALPGAAGPLGKLVALLTPWLETLFPADLARRGATQADRLIPPRGAAVRHALDTAMISLGARSYAPFLTRKPGIEIGIENTQPPSLIASADVEGLPDSARAFLAGRAMDLLTHGWALIGKFAPRDVGILLELACRFAGGSPPSLGLPEQRAGAFLKALEASVPVATRGSAGGLGQAAAAELASLDPRRLSTALRRTANRVALVHAGDPGAALSVLAQLERRSPAQGPEPRPLELADVRDLASFALSEAFLDLRLSVRS
jgi:tetratricopeptide (TPR) repeat protein